MAPTPMMIQNKAMGMRPKPMSTMLSTRMSSKVVEMTLILSMTKEFKDIYLNYSCLVCLMTRRQDVIKLLEEGKYSAQQLSNQLVCDMWEIVEDLKHIGKSVYPRLRRTHPLCKQCGFEFKERSKIKAPGKCPHCKNHSIIPSMFYIESLNVNHSNFLKNRE